MKLLLDENLSPRLAALLVDCFPEVVHVRDVGLTSADDNEVWEYAGTHDFVIVTKDADFNQRAFLLGPPPKVVWLRIGNASTNEIAALLNRHAADVNNLERPESGTSLLALA